MALQDMKYNDDEIVELVYEMLTKQRFVDWYEGKFVDHIGGEEDCASKQEILSDLKKLL